jgi:PAS domain S-box-containing protein
MYHYVVWGVALSIFGAAMVKALFMRGRASGALALDQPIDMISPGTLEALFQETPVATVLLDRQANVWKWNPAAERMFGWARHEVLRRPTPIMRSVADHTVHARILGGETVRGVELTRRGKDSKPVEIALTAIPFRDGRGAVIGVLEWMVEIPRRSPWEPPSPADLNEVVQQVQRKLERLTRNDIVWVTRLDPKAPRIEVDSDDIQQALMTLVVQACDTMPDGGILTIETVSVGIGENPPTARRKAVAGHYALVAVSDTGAAFKNASNEGLGLAIVRRIVTEAGGWMQVHSEPGNRSRFEIYLPQIS